MLDFDCKAKRGTFDLEAAFSVATPGVTALFGRSGSGKSTILRAIAGLVAAKQGWPESGWSRWLDAWHFAEGDFAWIGGPAGVILGIVLVLAVSALLYRAGRSGERGEGLESRNGEA